MRERQPYTAQGELMSELRLREQSLVAELAGIRQLMTGLNAPASPDAASIKPSPTTNWAAVAESLEKGSMHVETPVKTYIRQEEQSRHQLRTPHSIWQERQRMLQAQMQEDHHGV